MQGPPDLLYLLERAWVSMKGGAPTGRRLSLTEGAKLYKILPILKFEGEKTQDHPPGHLHIVLIRKRGDN